MSIPKCIATITNRESIAIRLVIRAKPGAKKSDVISIDDESIGVQIAAPPRYVSSNLFISDFVCGLVRFTCDRNSPFHPY